MQIEKDQMANGLGLNFSYEITSAVLFPVLDSPCWERHCKLQGGQQRASLNPDMI